MLARRKLIGGLVIVLLVGGVAAILVLRSKGSHRSLSNQQVVDAFASRGLHLAPQRGDIASVGDIAHIDGYYSNAKNSEYEGRLFVIVTRTSSEAAAIANRVTHILASDGRDPCGNAAAKDGHAWHARNVAATFGACVYVGAKPTRISSPITRTVDAVMRDLAG